MQAAGGLSQVQRLAEFVAVRRRIWQDLRDGLRHLEDVFILPVATANSDPSWFGFCLTLRADSERSRRQPCDFQSTAPVQRSVTRQFRPHRGGWERNLDRVNETRRRRRQELSPTSTPHPAN